MRKCADSVWACRIVAYADGEILVDVEQAYIDAAKRNGWTVLNEADATQSTAHRYQFVVAKSIADLPRYRRLVASVPVTLTSEKQRIVPVYTLHPERGWPSYAQVFPFFRPSDTSRVITTAGKCVPCEMPPETKIVKDTDVPEIITTASLNPTMFPFIIPPVARPLPTLSMPELNGPCINPAIFQTVLAPIGP